MIPPPRRRRPRLAPLAALLLLSTAVGCARTGTMLSLNPRRGMLRENLSRLEFQNQQLKDELKVARDDSKRLANDLQLAEIDNDDLERRLNSYRTQLGLNPQGGDRADSYELARPGFGEASPDLRPTRPAARPPSPAPFTQIPNRGAIDVSPPPGPSAEEGYGGFGTRRAPAYEERTRPHIEPPPVQYFDLSPSAVRSEYGRGGPSTWSPLARGSGRGPH